ncbi:MAG: RNA pseudouridine synthase [Bacteroidota bacterium]
MDNHAKIGDSIIYRNNQLLAFNKPATTPSVPQPGEVKSLLELGEIYSKKKLYAIHRLDRPASGVLLFAKNTDALEHLNQQFRNRTVEKTYLALVKQAPNPKQGTLHHFLQKQKKGNKSIALAEANEETKEALMDYEIVGQSENFHLLQIKLQTGRHHQIRAQLAAIGSPIRGDNKYGYKRGNRDRSIQLHAWKLRFDHPISGDRETVVAPPPADPVWNPFVSFFQ